MRTTLTLDDDVADALRRRAQQTGLPFKQVVNDALRAGLVPRQSPSEAVDVHFPVFSMELRPGVDLSKARRLADELEDGEISRKLDMRK
jgi:hypothetical protein